MSRRERPCDERSTSFVTDRRRALRGASVALSSALAGCLGVVETGREKFRDARWQWNRRDTLVNAFFDVRRDGDVDFVLEFGLDAPDDALASLSASNYRIRRRNPADVEWYDPFASREYEIRDFLERLESESDRDVAADPSHLASTETPSRFADEDWFVAGRIENATRPWTPADGPTIVPLPKITYDGAVTPTPGTTKVQLPDGQLHQYPPPQAGRHVADVNDGEVTLVVNFTGQSAAVERDGSEESFVFAVEPRRYPDAAERSTVTELVPRHRCVVHPSLAALASLWDTASYVFQTAYATIGHREELTAELRTDAMEFVRFGTAAAFSPIAYPDPERESEFTQYFPLGPAADLPITEETAGLGSATALYDLVGTARDMNESVDRFAAKSEEFQNAIEAWLNSVEAGDAAKTDWEALAAVCGFVATVGIQSLATATAETAVEQTRGLLDALVGEGGAYRPPIGPEVFESETETIVHDDVRRFVDREVRPFVGSLNAGGTLDADAWTELETLVGNAFDSS